MAVYRLANGNMDVWSYEVRRKTWERLTFDPGDDIFPLWSPDATSIVFGAVRQGQGPLVQLFRKSVNLHP